MFAMTKRNVNIFNLLIIIGVGGANALSTDETLKLLNEGDKEIKLSAQKEVFLILGNTGSGKSTFLQWISGDNSKLIAKEVTPGTGEYIIEDEGDRIGSSTINSKTFLPELVEDAVQKTASYDCPGFSDTRSSSHEIAITYFIKKIVDHADSVKLVFIVGYPSVRQGVDRQDFMRLLRHTAELITNLDKFKKSIAIVVSKVDNNYIRNGTSFVLVDNDKVIEGIADFLRETRNALKERLSKIKQNVEEQTFLKKSIQFLDILLITENNKFPMIGIFRRPDVPGPLSENKVMQDEKQHIRRILFEKLKYTAKSAEDFGHTISDRSKNDVNKLAQEINTNVTSQIVDIAENLQIHFKVVTNGIQEKIKLFATDSKAFSAELSEAQNFVAELESADKNIAILVANVNELKSLSELSGKIENFYMSMNIMKPDLTQISAQGRFFDFFQTFSSDVFTFSASLWAKAFQDTRTLLLESRKAIKTDNSAAVEKIRSKISADVDKIAQVVQTFYSNKAEAFEIQTLHNELNKGAEAINVAIIGNNKLDSFSMLPSIINDFTYKLNLNDGEITSSTSSINKNMKYLRYLQTLNNEHLSIEISTWVKVLQSTAAKLTEKSNWYKYLIGVYQKLSKFEFQSDTSKFNVFNLDDWGKAGKVQGLTITKSNFHQFSDKIGSVDENLKISFENNDVQQREINQIISLTLKEPFKVACPGEGKVFVKGDFIKLSELVKPDQKFKDLCLGVPQKEIQIFALNTIFIDASLNYVGGKLKLMIVAPRWEIVGRQMINLDGFPGGSLPKANSGSHAGSSGDNGNPGLPGGSAGVFFGIEDEIINNQGLTITANGGTGGFGQDGGDGAEGRRGKDADNFKQICRRSNSNGYLQRTQAHKVSGGPGGPGGNGGNSGKGGQGGHSGSIDLMFTNENRKIVKLNEVGSSGNYGKVGKGALGGLGGRNHVELCGLYESSYNSVTGSFKYWQFMSEYYENNAQRSSSGQDGSNSDQKTPSAPEAAVEIANKAIVVNDFKNFLRNYSIGVRKDHLMRFLNKLNESKNIKSLYNSLGLVNEFTGLENQFHKINKRSAEFYESFLSRVDEYAKTPNNNEKTSQHKKVLSYLYTAALSKIYSLQDETESNLIIDIHGYIKIATKDIKALKSLTIESNKFEMVKKHKESYINEINKKIAEASSFIATQITPEINSINNEINSEIDDLINETNNLIEQGKDEHNKLSQKREELRNAMNMRGLFNGIRFIGQVIGVLGPVGSAVGAVIGIATDVTESLTLDSRMARSARTFQIPPSVSNDLRTLETQIKTAKRQKASEFTKVLEDIAEEISEYEDASLKEVAALIENIGSRMSSNDSSEVTEKLRNELEQELKAKEDAAKKAHDKKVATVVGRVKNMVSLAKAGLDIYNKYKADKSKLDVITEAMKEVEEKIKKLREYEDKIYDSMIAAVQSMRISLDEVANSLGDKSQVALDITKWKIQGTLKDLKLQMQQFTKGFRIEQTLARYIEKLEEAMITLINIYDRLQDYQDQQKLANFIADIGSPAANNIAMNDPELSSALSKLEISTRSNIILQEYKFIVDAFKQWIFPFADFFFKGLKLPTHLELNTGILNLIDTAVSQIGHINSKLSEYKTSIVQHDKDIVTAQFDSSHISSKPFFVWQTKKFSCLIKKLLSGKKVVLNANVLESDSDKDAVKFNLIEIYFKAANRTVQNEIDEIIKRLKVSATHLGNSYYKFGRWFYVISSAPQTIFYSFEKNSANEPIHQNQVYQKIRNGDIMLSPYAMWEIQLIDLTKSNIFDKLEKFNDDIDVELVGKGNYVIEGSKVFNVQDYYKEGFHNLV